MPAAKFLSARDVPSMVNLTYNESPKKINRGLEYGWGYFVLSCKALRDLDLDLEIIFLERI